MSVQEQATSQDNLQKGALNHLVQIIDKDVKQNCPQN